MPPLEFYLEHAPQHAQDIVNQWGLMFESGSEPPAQFDDLINIACNYLDAKRHRENHEDFEFRRDLKGCLDDAIRQARANEASKRLAFAEAYKAREEKRNAPFAA